MAPARAPQVEVELEEVEVAVEEEVEEALLKKVNQA